MKIGLRAGHSPNCIGAVGIVDEYSVNKAIYDRLAPLLEQYGNTVVCCNSSESNPKSDLKKGTDIANNNTVDIFISIHNNCFNGNAYGTEALCYDENSTTAVAIAKRFCDNYSKLGFYNRGVKFKGGDLHDLRETNMEAVIIEGFFVDSQNDCNIYNSLSWDSIIYAYANAIDPNIPRTKPQPEQPKPQEPTTSNGDTYFRVVCGSYKERTNAEDMQNKLKAAGFDSFLVAYQKE